MELKELIKEVIDVCPKDLDIGITFEVGLMSDGRTICEQSKNRVKFSICKK
jgi:hypothetical protein